MKKILDVLSKLYEDFLILAGIIFILIATFEINLIAGLYVCGFACLIVGILMARR